MNTIKKYNYQNLMIFVTFFLLWVSVQFGEVVEDYLAYILVISIGIIHGANDLLILSTKEQNNKRLKKNLIIYIGIIFLCILTYLYSSFVAILLFVLLSAYHFGEEHFEQKINVNPIFNLVYFSVYGLLIFSLLFYQSLMDVDAIMIELTGKSFTKLQIELSLLSSSILLFLGSLYLIIIQKYDLNLFVREFFYLVLLFLVFKTSSLVLGFAIYFIFWHSIPSIIHQIEFISGNLNRKNIFSYIKKAMIYWAISIFSLIILYKLVPQLELFATVVFVILFAVTAPHTWVMYKMKN
jgi:Brp/Blh family beta-carotene 15,15'-monooxygenase|tara:strand:+ start:828 stop:1712 length:885 start_codon:yes stop_codon:yes gene_type:complete